MDRNKVLEILNNNKDKDFVDRIINPSAYPVLDNPDGTYSTHSMAWEYKGANKDKAIVYPTVLNVNGELKRFDSMDAHKGALGSGEYIEFDSPEEADDFSRSYKSAWDSPVDSVEVREPYKSELDYFKSNPNVAGMAAEDGRVIINPFSNLSEEQKQSVVVNEKARAYMRSSKNRPRFKLTDKQKEQFREYGSLQDIRETIAARILSKDPSALDFTPEQENWVLENISSKWPKPKRFNNTGY